MTALNNLNKNIVELVRPHLISMHPYTCARDEFEGDADIFLDANENPYDLDYTRYPDPYQNKLKECVAKWRGCSTDQIFVGHGSDEIIELLIRAFCVPLKDAIMVINPTYGMYKVSADVNQIESISLLMNDNLSLPLLDIKDKAKENVKIIFLCSPNNPTGHTIDNEDISFILDGFKGVVVVDEAYIDFSSQPSSMSLLPYYTNLIVLHTMSKAYGAAGIRVGFGFMHPTIVYFLNKIKPPYNLSTHSIEMAIERINQRPFFLTLIDEIKAERIQMTHFLRQLPFVLKVLESEANFILFQVRDPSHLYLYLSQYNIVVRNRSTLAHCEGGLRLTVGTPTQNKRVKDVLISYKKVKY